MKIVLCCRDICKVPADGIIVPVDGSSCELGDTATSRALRGSIIEGQRSEAYARLKHNVMTIGPIPEGYSRVIEGLGNWKKLIIIAAKPHNGTMSTFSRRHLYYTLRNSLYRGFLAGLTHGLESIAMNVLSHSYLLPSDLAASCMADVLAIFRDEPMEIRWCFLAPQRINFFKKICARRNIEWEEACINKTTNL